jgi:hypothetical protein
MGSSSFSFNGGMMMDPTLGGGMGFDPAIAAAAAAAAVSGPSSSLPLDIGSMDFAKWLDATAPPTSGVSTTAANASGTALFDPAALPPIDFNQLLGSVSGFPADFGAAPVKMDVSSGGGGGAAAATAAVASAAPALNAAAAAGNGGGGPKLSLKPPAAAARAPAAAPPPAPPPAPAAAADLQSKKPKTEQLDDDIF